MHQARPAMGTQHGAFCQHLLGHYPCRKQGKREAGVHGYVCNECSLNFPFEDSVSYCSFHLWLKDEWDEKLVTRSRLRLELWEIREFTRKMTKSFPPFSSFLTLPRRNFLRKAVRMEWGGSIVLSREHRNEVKQAWNTFPTLLLIKKIGQVNSSFWVLIFSSTT